MPEGSKNHLNQVGFGDTHPYGVPTPDSSPSPVLLDLLLPLAVPLLPVLLLYPLQLHSLLLVTLPLLGRLLLLLLLPQLLLPLRTTDVQTLGP